MKTEIDHDALKKRGFLSQKQDGDFLLRTRMTSGNYSSGQLAALIKIAEKYGRGLLHATTRQGLEIPHIKYEKIDEVEAEVKAAGINTGTSGARLRTTTACPGTNWCRSGLINTFELADKLEAERGIKCAMDLPHKLKIAISGCPNKCTRPEVSEIGIHGKIDTKGSERRTGYTVYLGGCGGRAPRIGFAPEKIFTEAEVLSLVERVVRYHKDHAKPRQRLALLIDEVGREAFLKAIGI